MRCQGCKVKWVGLCLPKRVGGFGIHSLESWNKACILKNLYLILIKLGSLLVALGHKHLFK